MRGYVQFTLENETVLRTSTLNCILRFSRVGNEEGFRDELAFLTYCLTFRI